MGKFIKAEFETKLNSQHYDFVESKKEDDCKIILQQFKNAVDVVYLILNGVQVTIPTGDLKVAVDSMYERQLKEEKNKSKALEKKLLEIQLEMESLKLKEMKK